VPPRALFPAAAAVYAAAFADGDGADAGIAATFQTIHLAGWAPSETQPKPLRPGSAKMRLADALGVPEERA
jgi:hypothetical protein